MKRRTFLAAAASAALPLPAIAAPAKDKLLKFVPQANLTSLDPIWTTAAVTQNHGHYVFDTLYAVDHTMTPRPQMAEGHTVSSDGQTWMIRLRDGLKFHDNEPVRAQDCAASLARWSARDTFGAAVAQVVDAWEAADDRTLRVRLKRPFPLLLDAIGKPGANLPFIMPERLAKTDPTKQVTEMIGSGPYRFVTSDYVSGSHVAYRKFDGYVPRQEKPEWMSGGKVAHFERVEWQIIPDPATASAALQNAEIDWWEQVLPDLVQALRGDHGVKVGIADPTGYIGVMRFNMLYPPFDKVKMRQAIAAAVDQNAYLRAVTGNDPSAWHVCHSMFPCGTPYGTTANPDPMAHPSIDRAKQMIAEAGYDGEKIVIINPSDFPTIEPFGQITYDTLHRLGLNVELQETDWGTVVQRRASRKPVNQGGWSIFHTWWTGEGIINPAVSSIIRGQGSKGWFGWYDNPEMEKLASAWLQAPTPAERARIASEMQAIAFRDVPTIPLGQFFIHTAYRTDLADMLVAPAPLPWNVRRA